MEKYTGCYQRKNWSTNLKIQRPSCLKTLSTQFNFRFINSCPCAQNVVSMINSKKSALLNSVKKASSVDITIVGTSGELPMASAVASLLLVVIKGKFLDVAKLPETCLDSVGLRIVDKEAPVGTTVAPEMETEIKIY
uniref:Uncharacterized protein n=1 Tax=Glossina pallidipes TaxID=7398 RepID=A0A1A9ZJY9_GLOPL